MIGGIDILAVRDIGGLINLIIIIAILSISIAVRLGERWLRKYAEEKADEARRRREADQQGIADAEQYTGRPAEQQAGGQQLQPYAARRQPSAPAAAYQQPSRQAPQRPARPYGPIPPQLIVPGAARAVPPAPPKPQPTSRAVEKEIARLQYRLKKLDQLRQDRLAVRVPEEADTAGIEARLISLQPAAWADPVAADRSLVAMVDISNPARARLAMIFHEIFSSPKALRQERQMWEI